jgi:hypothetical protein
MFDPEAGDTPLARLVRSTVRQEMLALFAAHPEKSFHARGLDRLLRSDYRNIHREARLLVEMGLLEMEQAARRKDYRLARSYPYWGFLWPLALIGGPVVTALESAADEAGVGFAMLLLGGADGGLELWASAAPGWYPEPLVFPEGGPALSLSYRRVFLGETPEQGEAALVAEAVSRPRLLIRGTPGELLRLRGAEVERPRPVRPRAAAEPARAPRRRRFRPPEFDPGTD